MFSPCSLITTDNILSPDTVSAIRGYFVCFSYVHDLSTFSIYYKEGQWSSGTMSNSVQPIYLRSAINIYKLEVFNPRQTIFQSHKIHAFMFLMYFLFINIHYISSFTLYFHSFIYVAAYDQPDFIKGFCIFLLQKCSVTSVKNTNTLINVVSLYYLIIHSF